MIANVRALMVACQKLRVECKLVNSTQNLVRVHTPTGHYLFVNATTPINSHAISRFCSNKYYTYRLLSDRVRMPKTEAFDNFFDNKNSCKGDTALDLGPTIREIEKGFVYPLILKPNRGNGGKDTLLIENREALHDGIDQLFSQEYATLLAQQYIHVNTEYRAIFLGGELSFAYEKNVDTAVFQGNISPLHWQGAKAILVEQNKLLQKMVAFVTPIFTEIEIPFVGVDLAVDKDGQFWMLELNSAPGFNFFVRSCGSRLVEDLYVKILCNYLGCTKQ